MPLKTMQETMGRLLASLEEGDSAALQEAQEEFSRAVEEAWQAYQSGGIRTQLRGQALPRTMYLFATQELPEAIADSQQWPGILRTLRGFRQTMNLVLVPEEVDA